MTGVVVLDKLESCSGINYERIIILRSLIARALGIHLQFPVTKLSTPIKF